MKKFETFEHEADVGIRGYGKTLEEAFSNALKALATLFAEELPEEGIKRERNFEVELKAGELVDLFVAFINKVLTLFYLEEVLFWEFEGAIENSEEGLILRGKLWGEPFSVEKFGYGVEVKGATFTLAEVKKTEEGWIAQCVVDV